MESTYLDPGYQGLKKVINISDADFYQFAGKVGAEFGIYLNDVEYCKSVPEENPQM